MGLRIYWTLIQLLESLNPNKSKLRTSPFCFGGYFIKGRPMANKKKIKYQLQQSQDQKAWAELVDKHTTKLKRDI